MSERPQLFTSESVSEGHPDKIADRISDTCLDLILERDPGARVALETLVTNRYCVIAGEVTGPRIDYRGVVRSTIVELGHSEDQDFGPKTLQTVVRVRPQAREIAQAVDAQEELGAGDQGIVFGYACRETPALLPAPIFYAHRILEELARRRRTEEVAGLRPDAKSQVTLEYHEGRPVRAHTIVVSHQHWGWLSRAELEASIRDVLTTVLPAGWVDEQTRLLVNPSGSFLNGGPGFDTGLTGRKIIVDTYGGAVPHGGGAFSGKDATKLDRAGAYAARHLAKNVVAAGLAERCLLQLAYAIGVADPVALCVDTSGTGQLDDRRLERLLLDAVPLTPRAIRTRLGLDRPIFARTASYGHFGRAPEADGGFSWERTDLVDVLRRGA